MVSLLLSAVIVALVVSAQAARLKDPTAPLVRQQANCVANGQSCGPQSPCCDGSGRCVNSSSRGGTFCLRQLPFVRDSNINIQMFEAGVANPRAGPVLQMFTQICPTLFENGFSLFCQGTPADTQGVRWYVNSNRHSREERSFPWTLRGDRNGAAIAWPRSSHMGLQRIRCRTNQNRWNGVIVFFTDSACEGNTVTTPPTTAAPTCDRTRRSINDYSNAEWGQFVAAIERMRANGQWDGMVRTHADNEFQWHRGSYFLPAHRQMLWEFENLLRSPTGGNCPSCTVPYWDWSLTFDRWTTDPVWQRTGGCNGGTVPNSPFNNWLVQNREPHIIRRICQSGQPTEEIFESRASLDILVRGDRVEGTNFPEFARYLEISHGSPHNNIGGDMADGEFSPNDPMFYLHHANIDRIWQQWMNTFGTQFGGRHRCGARATGSQAQATCPVNAETGMAPWGRTVTQILGQLTSCVTYAAPTTAVRMRVANRNYLVRDKPSVAETAAETKINKVKEYKSACALIRRSKQTFRKGGKQVGYSDAEIDEAEEVKKALDTVSYEVLEEDFEKPEDVIYKPDEVVAEEGKEAKAKIEEGTSPNSRS